MADTIRTGIVGATVTQGGSGWGANAHVPALHLLPDYTLQAVCTAHEDTAQASKEKFDAVHAFHDIDAMARIVREGIEARGYEPRIAVRNRHGQGKRRDSLARERTAVERTFAWLSYMRRLATRWERRDDLYLAFLTLGCAVVCWRRLAQSL